MMPACTGPTGIWCRPSPVHRQEFVGRRDRAAPSAAASRAARASPRRRDRARAAGPACRAARSRRDRASRAPAGSPARWKRPTEGKSPSAHRASRRRRAAAAPARAAPCARCPSRPTGPAGRRRPRPAPAPTAIQVVVVDLVARPRPVAGHRRRGSRAALLRRSAHRRHPSCAATARNQRTTGSGSHRPATSTIARCRNSGTIGRLDLARPARSARRTARPAAAGSARRTRRSGRTPARPRAAAGARSSTTPA